MIKQSGDYGDRSFAQVAALIRAAPDLLCAAKALIAANDAYDEEPGAEEACIEALEGLRATIAKAEDC